MRLSKELLALDCPIDEEAFRETLGDVFSHLNRGHSAENLLCRWWDARKFCEEVRRRIGIKDEGDNLILRTVLNLRKDERLEKIGRGGSRKRLTKTLEEVSPRLDVGQFRAAVREVYLKLFKPMTVDQIITRWGDASHFCGCICVRLKVERNIAVDALILATLVNMRRSSGLDPRRRRAAKGRG